MIKTGFCVAYDWEYLKTSLPRVYASSDLICLALDKNRITWGCKRYAFDEDAFRQMVASIDEDNKIIIYEDEFSIQENNSRENCNRQRMMIADKMGKGGWHIQVDSDEYFLNFDGFVGYLKNLNACPTGNEKPYNVLCNWIPLVKKLNDGILYVNFEDKMSEMAPFATTLPNYERARHNGFFNKVSPYYVVHETWARDEKELWFKINNWGHAAEELETEESRNQYFNRWKSLTKDNFLQEKNVHPTTPSVWPALKFGNGKSIEEFIDNLETPKYPLSDFMIKVRNNRNVARIKHLLKRILH